MSNIPALRRFIRHHEGLVNKVYFDSEGVATIGIGRNLSGKGLSNKEAWYLFGNDTAEAMQAAHTYGWFHDCRLQKDHQAPGSGRLRGRGRRVPAVQVGQAGAAPGYGDIGTDSNGGVPTMVKEGDEGGRSMKRTVEERFWGKVDQRGADECWDWQVASVVHDSRLWTV
jgi:hypothetical protein